MPAGPLQLVIWLPSKFHSFGQISNKKDRKRERQTDTLKYRQTGKNNIEKRKTTKQKILKNNE